MMLRLFSWLRLRRRVRELKQQVKELKRRAKALRRQARRRKVKARGLEAVGTPLEIAALLQQPEYRDFPFYVASSLRRRPPTRYNRYPLCETVNLYSANCGASDLLVTFCGAGIRLGPPISYFLQLIRDDVYDVLHLADPSRRHFVEGLPGYSSSSLETLQSIRSFAQAEGYRRIITYGASMGGFPALRAGLWLGAERAVSVGGSFCSHPVRLTDPQHQMPAFDLLCHCRPNHHRNTRVVAGFSKDNELDAQQYRILKQIIPDCITITFDSASHNAFGGMDEHDMAMFFAKVFDEHLIADGCVSRLLRPEPVAPRPSA